MGSGWGEMYEESLNDCCQLAIDGRQSGVGFGGQLSVRALGIGH